MSTITAKKYRVHRMLTNVYAKIEDYPRKYGDSTHMSKKKEKRVVNLR
jgi:hypothetical protein